MGAWSQLYKALFTLTCFYLSGFVNHITPLVPGPGAMNEAEFFQWSPAKLGPRKLRLFKLKLIICQARIETHRPELGSPEIGGFMKMAVLKIRICYLGVVKNGGLLYNRMLKICPGLPFWLWKKKFFAGREGDQNPQMI